MRSVALLSSKREQFLLQKMKCVFVLVFTSVLCVAFPDDVWQGWDLPPPKLPIVATSSPVSQKEAETSYVPVEGMFRMAASAPLDLLADLPPTSSTSVASSPPVVSLPVPDADFGIPAVFFERVSTSTTTPAPDTVRISYPQMSVKSAVPLDTLVKQSEEVDCRSMYNVLSTSCFPWWAQLLTASAVSGK